MVVCVIATGLQFINSIFSTLFTYTRELTLQASQRYNLLQGCCFGLHKIVQLYLINWQLSVGTHGSSDIMIINHRKHSSRL